MPDDYQVKIIPQEKYVCLSLSLSLALARTLLMSCYFVSPILGVWRGGSVLASSPDFESMCVTKSEYEEMGSARCRRRFFRSYV